VPRKGLGLLLSPAAWDWAEPAEEIEEK